MIQMPVSEGIRLVLDEDWVARPWVSDTLDTRQDLPAQLGARGVGKQESNARCIIGAADVKPGQVLAAAIRRTLGVCTPATPQQALAAVLMCARGVCREESDARCIINPADVKLRSFNTKVSNIAGVPHPPSYGSPSRGRVDVCHDIPNGRTL